MAYLKFVCLFLVASGASVLSGPPQKVTVKGITACKSDGKSSIKFNKKDGNMDIDLDMPTGFDDKLEANVDMMTGGEGKSVMKSNGPACKLMTQYLSPLMKRISKSFEPALPAKCPWTKGLYSIKGLDGKFSSSDFSVASLPIGSFKLTISVKDKNKVVFCAVADLTVTVG